MLSRIHSPLIGGLRRVRRLLFNQPESERTPPKPPASSRDPAKTAGEPAPRPAPSQRRGVIRNPRGFPLL